MYTQTVRLYYNIYMWNSINRNIVYRMPSVVDLYTVSSATKKRENSDHGEWRLE